MAEVVIYGGGGFAREVAWLAESCQDQGEPYEVVAFVDDDRQQQGRILNGIPVVSLDTAAAKHQGARIVAAVGDPATRKTIMERAELSRWVPATLVHERTELSRFVEIGEGTVVCAGNILTINIRLGRHVHVNLDCTIGHDVILGDFTTLAPGVHVSGWVHMGERVYVGTGAVIINGTAERPIIIGDGAVVGAGACVTKSVASDVTVVGVPARPR